MKLSILRKNLKEGIELTSRLAQKSINLPILSNVLLTAEKNVLKMSSTDLEMGVNVWRLAQVEEQGQAVVPGKVLLGLINASSEEQIQFNSDGHNLKIKGSHVAAKVLGQNPEDYPIIPIVEESFLKMDAGTLSRALSRVVDFTATTQIRPELAGVYIAFTQEGLTVASSDSFRLAEKKVKLQKGSAVSAERIVIVPVKAAREVAAILQERDGDVHVLLSDNQIMFELEGEGVAGPQLQVVTQLIEGSYPNYKAVIPSEFATDLTLDKEAFISTLRSVSLFAGKAGEVRLSVRSKKKDIELFCQSADLGENKTTLEADVSGDDVAISFNVRFLLEGLAKFSSPKISFRLSGKEGPALLHDEKEEDYLYIVMPIKATE